MFFCAADIHLITGVIPFNFKCDDGDQSKLTSCIDLPDNTKLLYQVVSTMSDTSTDRSSIRGGQFRTAEIHHTTPNTEMKLI